MKAMIFICAPHLGQPIGSAAYTCLISAAQPFRASRAVGERTGIPVPPGVGCRWARWPRVLPELEEGFGGQLGQRQKRAACLCVAARRQVRQEQPFAHQRVDVRVKMNQLAKGLDAADHAWHSACLRAARKQVGPAAGGAIDGDHRARRRPAQVAQEPALEPEVDAQPLDTADSPRACRRSPPALPRFYLCVSTSLAPRATVRSNPKSAGKAESLACGCFQSSLPPREANCPPQTRAVHSRGAGERRRGASSLQLASPPVATRNGLASPPSNRRALDARIIQ